MKDKELNYVVFENFEVELINSKIKTVSSPLFFIKSKFRKKSGGQGLYTYYTNLFFDSNHNLINNNKIAINDISCIIENKESWKRIKGFHYSVSVTTKITDKLGLETEKVFSNGIKPEDRFKSLFKYLQLLNKAGTHESCKIIEEKNHKISILEKRIERYKNMKKNE